jgi:predicted molibdopterin-dependent oxidoreductase YjgC
VLYLIGEDIPANLEGDPFILYQNICLPSAGHIPTLLLPTEAFTEGESSLTDQAGATHLLHKAVQAPGKSQAAWKVLCEIASCMGAEGFAYETVEDIRAEMRSAQPFVTAGEYEAAQPLMWAAGQIGEHTYMGFALSKTVEGLQMLYPEETVG